jgi:hypothetical protein
MPARITEIGVGASTCASGSQVWNGTIGHLDREADEQEPEDPGREAHPEQRSAPGEVRAVEVSEPSPCATISGIENGALHAVDAAHVDAQARRPRPASAPSPASV